MRKLLRKRREGFSLIELLIVVAIIAALVGVAVPFFQDNLSEAQRTKPAQDIEVIKKAISLYDARESRPIVGTSLSPLLGRYMQELPKDPWGNDYLFDGACGMLASFGADALPDGTGGDTDITVYTKPPLMINRVQYQGSWGRPRLYTAIDKYATGNKFVITMTKPLEVVTPNAVAAEISLLRQAGTPTGNGVALISATAWPAITWESADGTVPIAFSPANIDPIHRPTLGVITVRAVVDQSAVPAAQSITPTMALDFAIAGDVNATAVGTAIIESDYQGLNPAGPLDAAVYGAQAKALYGRVPQAAELVNSARQGIKIEKY